MPISYGFRGGSEFWFARHEEPFHYPIPRGKELEPEFVFQIANKQDPGVRFTREACAALVVIPAPFLEPALGVFITKAKKQGVGHRRPGLRQVGEYPLELTYLVSTYLVSDTRY